MTVIRPCTCTHASQDKIHGAGNRVKNATLKKVGEKKQFRCTVCGKVE